MLETVNLSLLLFLLDDLRIDGAVVEHLAGGVFDAKAVEESGEALELGGTH